MVVSPSSGAMSGEGVSQPVPQGTARPALSQGAGPVSSARPAISVQTPPQLRCLPSLLASGEAVSQAASHGTAGPALSQGAGPVSSAGGAPVPVVEPVRTSSNSSQSQDEFLKGRWGTLRPGCCAKQSRTSGHSRGTARSRRWGHAAWLPSGVLACMLPRTMRSHPSRWASCGLRGQPIHFRAIVQPGGRRASA